MKCNDCEAIFGNHYEMCPTCGSVRISKEIKVTQVCEIVEVETITSFAVSSEITVNELENL